MIRATQQQLVDCIRAYQRANTREDMARVDALAAHLVGPPDYGTEGHGARGAPRAKPATRKARK